MHSGMLVVNIYTYRLEHTAYGRNYGGDPFTNEDSNMVLPLSMVTWHRRNLFFVSGACFWPLSCPQQTPACSQPPQFCKKYLPHVFRHRVRPQNPRQPLVENYIIIQRNQSDDSYRTLENEIVQRKKVFTSGIFSLSEHPSTQRTQKCFFFSFFLSTASEWGYWVMRFSIILFGIYGHCNGSHYS